jgi:hypothetical protein
MSRLSPPTLTPKEMLNVLELEFREKRLLEKGDVRMM